MNQRVILAGKRDSRHHSTTSFSKNDVMIELLSFVIGRGLTPFNKNNHANFSGQKKYKEALRGFYFLRIREKTLRVRYHPDSRP